MNRRALNIACVSKWKNARSGKFRPIEAIIIPNCLRVERAIIFLRSHSIMATEPAINMVVVEIIRIDLLNKGAMWRNG